MILAVVVVTASQLLDLGTFVRMVALHGPAAEANPLVSSLLVGEGVPFVTVTKIAALSLVVAVIVVLNGRPERPGAPRLATAIAFLAIVAGLIGGWTNASAIV